MQFWLPLGTKSPKKMMVDRWSNQAGSLALFLSVFMSPLYINAWINSCFCPVLLVVTLRKMESEAVVFVTVLPTIIPLGNISLLLIIYFDFWRKTCVLAWSSMIEKMPSAANMQSDRHSQMSTPFCNSIYWGKPKLPKIPTVLIWFTIKCCSRLFICRKHCYG